MPGLGFRRTGTRAGRHPFLWVGRESLSIDALSGQTGTLTAGSTSTITDTSGGTVTSNYRQPPYSYLAGQTVTGLLLGSGKYLAWTVNILPQTMCWMVDFVENGGVAVASAGVLYLGNSGATGARIYIDSTGTYYRATYTDGSTTRTSTLAAAPTSGQRVRLRVQLSATGTIRIHQSINGAAETSASESAATTLPAAWTGTTLYLNAVGTANTGANIYLGAVIMAGTQTATVLQAALT